MLPEEGIAIKMASLRDRVVVLMEDNAALRREVTQLRNAVRHCSSLTRNKPRLLAFTFSFCEICRLHFVTK